jgi:hypothetical protein
MRNLILMAKEKASRLDDEQLAAEIERLGKVKMRLSNPERGGYLDVAPLLLAVLKRELADRQKRNPKLERAHVVRQLDRHLDSAKPPLSTAKNNSGNNLPRFWTAGQRKRPEFLYKQEEK